MRRFETLSAHSAPWDECPKRIDARVTPLTQLLSLTRDFLSPYASFWNAFGPPRTGACIQVVYQNEINGIYQMIRTGHKSYDA